jgi:hypothetical protein
MAAAPDLQRLHDIPLYGGVAREAAAVILEPLVVAESDCGNLVPARSRSDRDGMEANFCMGRPVILNLLGN